jgi:hypothetical protein
MTNKADPWSDRIAVAQIPDTGLHRDTEADRAARDAMAEAAGLRDVLSARASFDVMHLGGGFVDDQVEGESEIPDPPEPIENGVIDLGRLATDVLFLAIDPYPRKPGAVFKPVVTAADPEDHPFAALKALQSGTKSSTAKKPKNS